MISLHAIERMRLRMTDAQSRYYARVIDTLAAQLAADRDYAVRVWRDAETHGAFTFTDHGGDSNGTDLWAIIRRRRVTTVMWRRPAQPCNAAAFGVDYVLGTKGR